MTKYFVDDIVLQENFHFVNQVKAGAVLNYVIIVLNALVGLLYTPYMLRMLGQNEYGLYSLVASIIAYLTILDFGFGNAIVRYTATFRAMNQKDEQWEMFGMFLIVYSIIGILAFGIGLLLYFNVDWLFDRTMTTENLSQARVMIMLLIVNLALTFPLSMFGSIITAYENFVFQKVVNIIRILLSTIVLVVLLYWGYKAVALVVVQTVFNIGTLLLNAIYCKYKIKIKIWFRKFNYTFLKEIAIYSFWIFLNAIMDRIYWSTGQFVLGSLVGTVAVAIFSVAILLQQMYMSMSTAMGSVLLPRITAMIANERNDKEISDLFIRTGRLQFIIIGLVLSGFIVFGRHFIDLWAGKGYADSYVITVIFFCALLIPLIQNTGITILQARNEMKFRSLLYIGIAIVSLGCQIWFSKLFGAIGCAIAIAGALLIGQGLIMNVYYSTKQRIDIGRFWKEIGATAIVPIIFTVTGITILNYIVINNWLTLGISVFLFLLLYLPSYWTFSTNQYERDLLYGIIRRLNKANR